LAWLGLSVEIVRAAALGTFGDAAIEELKTA
jgi:hypothetical protein